MFEKNKWITAKDIIPINQKDNNIIKMNEIFISLVDVLVYQ